MGLIVPFRTKAASGYLAQAERARQRAEQAINPEFQEWWKRIAEDYAALAAIACREPRKTAQRDGFGSVADGLMP